MKGINVFLFLLICLTTCSKEESFKADIQMQASENSQDKQEYFLSSNFTLSIKVDAQQNAADTTNNTDNTNSQNNTNPENNTNNQNSTNEQNNTQAEVVECQEICKQLQKTLCTLCYTKCMKGKVLQSFNMDTCQFKNCTLFGSQPYDQEDKTSTSTVCFEWQSKLLSEQECADICCHTTEYKTFNLDHIDQCVALDQQKAKSDNLITTILTSVIGGLMLIIVILVIFCCCRDKFIVCCKNLIWPFERCVRGDRIVKKDNQDQKDTHDTDKNMVTSEELQSRRQWFALDKKKQVEQIPTSKFIIESTLQIKQQNCCSICLDPQLNCETSCNHRLHFQCFRKFYQTKERCPDCPSIGRRKFNPLKIICQKCGTRYTKYEINEKNVKNKFPNFYFEGKIYCDQCLEVKKIEGTAQTIPQQNQG